MRELVQAQWLIGIKLVVWHCLQCWGRKNIPRWEDGNIQEEVLWLRSLMSLSWTTFLGAKTCSRFISLLMYLP